MATDDNTHETRKFSARELHSLADRLFSRGVSLLFEANHNLRVDLVIASACLRVFAIEHPDGIEVSVWRDLP